MTNTKLTRADSPHMPLLTITPSKTKKFLMQQHNRRNVYAILNFTWRGQNTHTDQLFWTLFFVSTPTYCFQLLSYNFLGIWESMEFIFQVYSCVMFRSSADWAEKQVKDDQYEASADSSLLSSVEGLDHSLIFTCFSITAKCFTWNDMKCIL